MKNQIDFEKESEMLKALGHPIRLKIIYGLLRHGDCNVNKIVEELSLPQSTISQHLSILRSRGIIHPRKEGVNTCYQVVDQKVVEILTILKK